MEQDRYWTVTQTRVLKEHLYPYVEAFVCLFLKQHRNMEKLFKIESVKILRHRPASQ